MLKVLTLSSLSLLIAFSVSAQKKNRKKSKASSDEQISQVVIALDKMNVLYIGVDNPVSIAVAGIPTEKISATISGNGSLTQIKPGNYIATVNTVDLRGDTKINVYVEGSDGSKKLASFQSFRVMRIPDPIAKVGGITEGGFKTTSFITQRGITAEAPLIPFDEKYSILKFEMTYISMKNDTLKFSNEGPLFSKEITDFLLNQCRPGGRCIFDNISVKCPDGTIRTIKPAEYRLY